MRAAEVMDASPSPCLSEQGDGGAQPAFPWAACARYHPLRQGFPQQGLKGKQDGLSKSGSCHTLGHQPTELPSNSWAYGETSSCVFFPAEMQIPLKIAPDAYMKTLSSVEDEVLILVTAIAEVEETNDKLTKETSMRFEYPPITVQVRQLPAGLWEDKG